MDRRNFLKGSAGVATGLAAGIGVSTILSHRVVDGGWRTKRTKPLGHIGAFCKDAPHLQGSGKNQLTLLWPHLEALTSQPLQPHAQAIGDCVAQAVALGIDILNAVQIRVKNYPDRWIAKTATEPIYAGCRIEVGGGYLLEEGAYTEWAMEWCRDYGTVLRLAYCNGKYDFTTYKPELARQWAQSHMALQPEGGVPDQLENIAKWHKIRHYTQVTSWSEARDAIANGYPVIVGSPIGFSFTRDFQGFAKRSGKWQHCMLLAGIDDNPNRRGGLFINSWGPNWNSGPKQHGQPDGSFWADANVIDEMLEWGSSYTFSNYRGYLYQSLGKKLY